ncbi:MAG: hypothetical protein L3J24_07920 [Xanthomonadales bacterium]|nr:hypothetical protein [Xanthomonadales bacterium]
MKKILIIVLLNLVLIQSAHSKNSPCSLQFKQAISSALDLTYQEYDQTPGQGLRSFSIDCQYEGALVTIFYLSKKEGLSASQKKNLSFHAGQALASSGHEDESIRYFNDAKHINNPSKLLWNEYIEGTIAYLNKDLQNLEKNISLIQKRKGTHLGNEQNLKVLMRLAIELERGVLYKDIDWTSDK